MVEQRPCSREDFEIAILCALPLEADAIHCVFDEFWDEDGDVFGSVPRDPNHYVTGRVGKHNVVLAMPGVGKANAASATAFLLSSYSNVRLTLLVGICGGVPQLGPSSNKEVLLGDVIVSNGIVEFDFGRRYPSGRFMMKEGIEARLSKNSKDVSNLLAFFRTARGRVRLQRRTTHNLKILQDNYADLANELLEPTDKYDYPGTSKDMLFPANYLHKHHNLTACGCSETNACDTATKLPCEHEDIRCDKQQLISPRKRLELKRQEEEKGSNRAQDPAIYIGIIASGDTVMKSGMDRDKIATQEDVLAFEMEGAGVWDNPQMSCLVIKGVCDYADSHKQKNWQNFAAATAASAMKALLEARVQSDPLERPAHSEVGLLQARIQGGEIVVSRVAINTIFHVLPLAQNELRPPPFLQPVVIIDARDQPLPFHLETITSKALLMHILQDRFEDLRGGKIQREEWVLEDKETGKSLDLSKPWNSLFKSGQVFHMSMVFRKRNSSTTLCPGCRFMNPGLTKDEVQCKRCGLVYRRVEEVQEIDVIEKEPMVPSTPIAASISGAPAREENRPPHLPRPRPPKPPPDEDEDLRRYRRVQIIETSLLIQKAKSKTPTRGNTGSARVTAESLRDTELLAVYLADISGLPEEDCLTFIRESGITETSQLFEKETSQGPSQPGPRTLAREDPEHKEKLENANLLKPLPTLASLESELSKALPALSIQTKFPSAPKDTSDMHENRIQATYSGGVYEGIGESILTPHSPTRPPLSRHRDRDTRELEERIEQLVAENREIVEVISPAGQNMADSRDSSNDYSEDAIPSPASPTRPPSLRRRQSMHIIDLESRLEQLEAENRQIVEARSQATHNIADSRDSSNDYNQDAIHSPVSPTRPPFLRRRQSMYILDLENRLEQLKAENRMLLTVRAQEENDDTLV